MTSASWMQADPRWVHAAAKLRSPATHAGPLRFEPGPGGGRLASPDGRGYRVTGRTVDLLEGTSDLATPAQRLMEAGFYAAGYEQRFRPRLTRLVTPETMGENVALATSMVRTAVGEAATPVVLDLACGTGQFARAFAEALGPDATVLGLDRSAPMLREATRLAGDAPGLLWLLADARRLPLLDGAVQASHCAGALHLFDDPQSVLCELARVTRVGGRVVISTFIRSPHPWLARTQRLLGGSVGFTWFELEELESLLRVARLEPCERMVQGQAVTLSGLVVPR